MSTSQTTISPHNQKPYITRQYPSTADLDSSIEKAAVAQKAWAKVSLKERLAIGQKFIVGFRRGYPFPCLPRTQDEIAQWPSRPELAEELCIQMGRPLAQNAGEFRGFLERATYLLSIAEASLADVDVGDKGGFKRYIRRGPLGVVFVIAPWKCAPLPSDSLHSAHIAITAFPILRRSTPFSLPYLLEMLSF